MKLHTNVLTERDVYRATTAAGMAGVRADVVQVGSRSRSHAFDVHLTGTSSRLPNGGARAREAYWGVDRDHAATWDEWGMFLAALYELDPLMVCGSPGRPAYLNRAAFHAATGGRFLSLRAHEQHGRVGHKWHRFDGVQRCDCGAMLADDYTYRTPADVLDALDSERRYTYGAPYFDQPYVAEGVRR